MSISQGNDLKTFTDRVKTDILEGSHPPFFMDNTEFIQKQQELNDAKQARVRLGIAWLLHGFTIPPIVSIMYSVKTNYWMPTIAATGAAVVALPIALVDFGFTLAVAPPITAATLLTTKSMEKRRKLSLLGPEQADALVSKVQ